MENIHALTRGTMEVVGQTVRDYPSIPTTEEMKFRLTLEFEELREKAVAMGLERTFMHIAMKSVHKNIYTANKLAGLDDINADLTSKNLNEAIDSLFTDTNIVDLVEVLDAALDQRVVASGTDLCFGFQHVIPDGDEAVFVSNMSKFDMERDIALKGVDAYAQNGITTYIETRGEYHIIKRAEDGKYLKSLNYSPVDLRNLVGINEPAED